MWLRLQTPWAALLGAALLYVIYLGIMFLVQRRMVFPGTTHALPGIPAATERRIERQWVDVEDGRVECWWLPPANPRSPYPVVIFAHGNLEFIDLWADPFLPMQELGFGVLLVEFPGYGRSTGTPTQQSIRQAFLQAYDRMVTRSDVDPDRVVLMGRSLGGGAICDLAARRPSAALILMSTFTCLRALSWRFLAPGFLVRDPFDNLSVIRGYEKPLLVIHGSRDGLIPHSQGARLAEAARNGRLITYDADHADCPPDWPVFWRDVEQFLSETEMLPRAPNQQ